MVLAFPQLLIFGFLFYNFSFFSLPTTGLIFFTTILYLLFYFLFIFGHAGSLLLHGFFSRWGLSSSCGAHASCCSDLSSRSVGSGGAQTQ